MIRKAEIKDINEINKLLFQVHKVHSDTRPDLFKEGSKKYNDNELLEIINDNDRPIFVYEENGKILGYIFCILIDYTSVNSLCDYKTIYIDDLCVDRDTRNLGVGEKLFNYVLNYAKSIDCYNVTLNVWAENKIAMKFYEKMGMKVQKIGMETILK